MGHSRETKARNREKILKLAAAKVRADGLDRLRVADLMQAAELTHGGFYGHFASREALLAAALDQALADGEAAANAGERGRGERTVKSILNGYLSAAHRDAPASGCAVAALAGDVARSAAEVRAILVARMERYRKAMATAFGDHPAASAFANAAWSMMVGAMVLARAHAGTPQADAILADARRAILDLERAMRS